MRRLLPVLLAFAVLTAACGSADPAEPAAAQPDDRWEHLADPPLTPRNGAVGAWTGDEVILVGGDEWSCPPTASCAVPEFPPLADGAAYDPDTDTWRSIADAPVPFAWAETAVIGDTVYFWLPATGRVGTRPAFLSYSPATDTWAELAWPGLQATDSWYRLVAAGDRLVAWAGSDEQGGGSGRLRNDAWSWAAGSSSVRRPPGPQFARPDPDARFHEALAISGGRRGHPGERVVLKHAPIQYGKALRRYLDRRPQAPAASGGPTLERWPDEPERTEPVGLAAFGAQFDGPVEVSGLDVLERRPAPAVIPIMPTLSGGECQNSAGGEGGDEEDPGQPPGQGPLGHGGPEFLPSGFHGAHGELGAVRKVSGMTLKSP